MTNDAATLLHCPNCQATNSLTNKFCQQCSTPLPQRYLWVGGNGLAVGSPGELLADRYLIIHKSVVFDTHPGLPPQAPEVENSQPIRPYLRLIPYRLNVPQVYGVLQLFEGDSPSEILLLEKPPIVIDSTGQQISLCSQLTDAWSHATSMRQLNWLWQIAQLWQPLKSEGVVSSLLDPYLLRVEGTLVRLLELHFDHAKTPELPQLGEFWQQLASSAKPAIADFVDQVSNLLIVGEIDSPELLIGVLDQGLRDLGRTQTPTIQIITKTDTGTRRERNEDACYPSSGTLLSKPPQTALAIVCDGIGGHEGGNVASNLAIETIQQQVQDLTRLPIDHIDPSIVLADLEKAVAVANDKISQRNDSENRQGRKRMGTTLVMALPLAHEMYITHVGDSRAYWITPQGCYQVTLDDDVASREVRLGYAIYREAVQQGGAGSLVQALGMSPSTSLHPTAQRFICDEDTVFLLTSDGLSDFDRVEEYWEKEILPILNGGKNLVDVSDRLIEIANTKNGHDNVTIALVHYQVKYSEPESTIQVVIPDSVSIPTVNATASPTSPTLLESDPGQPTKVLRQKTNFRNLPLNLIVPLLLAIAVGALGFWAKFIWENRNKPRADSRPEMTNPVTDISGERRMDNLQTGWIIRTKNPISLKDGGKLPGDTYLKVLNKKPNSQLAPEDYDVSLYVCTNPGSVAKTQVITLLNLKKSGVDVLQADDQFPCDTSSNGKPQTVTESK
ncbi:PP2C family serine/threonine-protein phosphatase [Nostoc sp. UHCC 0870]|uniref:PP2C family serine/threonine-protein phosphatase n=1 Tax=Nostoc sp. UHCC 0870 TaxID=2914041 RepID=UPI001EDCCC44|nr:protein phosphatase 2C domain-containing protein [Nostoc sp. UHCC 0870]UKO96462.1 protein phosphatase 2C domain-containing protein [Nostoc sp. UHCC 0870]